MRVYIAGHKGMVGSAIWRYLERHDNVELIGKTRSELDLLDQREVYKFLANEKPDYVYVAAAKVGGIHANNTMRADFIYENLIIQTNLIHGAFRAGIQDLCFLGSSCIYPKLCPQPIQEGYLLTGSLEETNEPYAVAKIAGLKMCQSYNAQYGTNYITLMPTNIFGPNDNFDLQSSHMLPALIRKAHEAKIEGKKEVEIWGTGTPKRDVLYVDDLARACHLCLVSKPKDQVLNVGSGVDFSIEEIAATVIEVVGVDAKLKFNRSMPDGTPRKILDVTKISKYGWQPEISLKDGIKLTYEAFLKTY